MTSIKVLDPIISSQDIDSPLSEDIDNLSFKIQECRNRGIPLLEIQKIFKENQVDDPQRWQALINLLENISPLQFWNISKKIKSLLSIHKLYDDKSIVFFMDQDEDKILSLVDELNNLMDIKYDKLIGGYTAYKAHQISEDFILYAFEKEKEFYKKEDIDLEDFNQASFEYFNEYKKIMGLRIFKLKCYDSVVVNLKEKYIILQLDLSSFLKSDEKLASYNCFIKMINTYFDEKSISDCRIPLYNHSNNLFNCLSNFYNNEEGYINRLWFTSSKGVHYEYLKSGATDVRKAKYHIGGINQEMITTYRVSKQFRLNDYRWPEIYLGLTYRAFASTDKARRVLREAHIFHIRTSKCYNFVLNKIIDSK